MADIRTVADLVTKGAQQFIKDYVSAQQAVQALNTTLQQSERIRTPQLAPQIQAINTALSQASGSARNYVQTLQQLQDATTQVTSASEQAAAGINKVTNASSNAKSSGISYLSTLSAIHAASFLASGSTFTLLGSFTTLGLAFSKLGPGAIGVGLAFGGILGIFGAVSNAAQLVQKVFLELVATAAKVGVAVAAAITVAAGAGVKAAADIQSQFALIAAIEGATTQQLEALEAKVSDLAVQFGVSAKDVTAAASLFVRAGGDIEGAINGAAEAIVKLVVASAGELQAAEAARAVATGLRAFSDEGVTAIQIANSVAAAAQRSALSFTEVSQAFQQAVPGSVTLGITLSDLTAIITTLGNNALRGTVAGTSFKQFLLDLVNPSVTSAKALAELNVNIVDSSKNIRPIIDIIADLNEALDQLTPGDRAKKIAEIFESRAGLAGAILSRTTISQLKELKAELDSLTVNNIVDVLLLPLNKQLERLGVTASELGRKFGGPLLDPLRAATVAAIDFFKQLIPVAELAGQIVGVVLANQGFGALQTKITDLVGNNNISAFLIELTNSFRNVADVVTNRIIPAFQQVIASFSEFADAPGKLDELGGVFDGINSAIQRTGAIIAAAIVAFGQLTLEFIKNEGRGGELRTQILNIAAAIATNFVRSIASMTVFLTAATVVMIKFGEVALKVISRLGIELELLAQHADNLGGAFEEGGLKARKALLGAQIGTALSSGDIEGAQKLKEELKGIDELLTKSIGPQQGTPIAQQLRQIAAGADDANKFSQELLRLLDPDAIQAEADKTLKVFEDLAGDVPSALANILAQATEFQRTFEEAARSQGAPPGIDSKAVETATNRVQELARDLGRKLANLAEDTSTRTGNIVDKGLERIGDIFEKADERLRDIGKDAQDQINEIFSNLGQRRDDRQRTDDLKDQLDQQLRDKQSELDSEERAEERALESKRLLRQRDTEDNSRILDEQFSDLERVLSRSQDATERGFRLIQRAREDSLKASQDAEERGLRASLDAQSNARRETQQLAGAKTPEERARVQQQIQESRAQTRFDQGQEQQLLSLRLRHDKQQRAASDSAELGSQTFRRGLEDQMLAFRKRNEETLRTVRRNIEDGERTTRETEEETQLQRRISRETRLRAFRETQERAIRQLQDTLEDEAANRQAGKIVAKAIDQANEIINNAVRQALEQETAIAQQLEEQRQAQERALRQAADSIVDFEENLSDDVKSALQPQLTALKTTLEREGQNLRDLATEQREAGLSRIGTTIGLGQIGLEALRPQLNIPTPNVPVQVTPNQVIQASVIQAAQLIIGQAAASQLAGAFLGGLRQAGTEGVFDSTIDLNPVTGAINQLGSPLINILRAIRP